MAYIKQCLDSIVTQTFKDYKLIIVDDMSTDMSDKVCEAYARRYPDKIIFKRAEEKWLAGKCRNWGIDYPIESEYTLFIDSDDMYYGSDALQTIYDNLNNQLDVLIYNYFILKNGNKIQLPYIQFNPKSNALANTAFNSAWSKAIKSSKMKRFLEGCMRGEDTYMWLQVLDNYPIIKQIQNSIYMYRLHGNNTVFSDVFKKDKKFCINNLKKILPNIKNPYVVASIKKRCGI